MIKKLLSAFLLATITAGASFAQVNGGFEAWDSTYSNPQEPTNWVTVNLFASPLVDATNPRSVYKLVSPNVAAGLNSMKIKTVRLITNPTQGLLNDTVGIAMQGSVSISPSLHLIDRIPYTARPLNFHYVYQYMPVNSDSCLVYVELTKWNNSLMRRDTVATFGLASHTTLNVWTTGMFPLYYWPNHPNTMTPDSMAIVFSSSATHPQIGSQFWVDDVYFTGWSSTNDIYSKSSSVIAFPNPAKDNITISADNIDNASAVIVYNGMGQTVGKFQMENKKYILNTSALRAGNYFYSVLDKSGTVITGNTFSIVK